MCHLTVCSYNQTRTNTTPEPQICCHPLLLSIRIIRNKFCTKTYILRTMKNKDYPAILTQLYLNKTLQLCFFFFCPGQTTTDPTRSISSTMPTYPPTVFRSLRVTSKPRKQGLRPGKSDSPMLNYIFDSYATSNKHFHDK